MSLIDRLERRWAGRLPHNLTWVLLGSWIASFILQLSRPEMVQGMLLSWGHVAQGEWWRIFSFAFLAPTMHPLILVIAIMFTHLVCSNLERHWGPLRTLIYAGLAWFGIVLASLLHALVAQALWGNGVSEQPYLMVLALIAFGTIAPNVEILLFFILPVKIKWLAMLAAASIVLMPVDVEWLRITNGSFGWIAVFCVLWSFLVAALTSPAASSGGRP